MSVPGTDSKETLLMTYKTDKLGNRAQAIAGPREWIYSDTGSTLANAVAAGFVSDGRNMGMKVGNIVFFSPLLTPFDASRLVVIEVQAQDTGVQFASLKNADTD
jgi:hypothetical protein